ncbi:unnamed protein product [Zymoseptoria tritici ST99CH_1E4]|nr:unnamed protein product [Zymoseptoria tritici ST99CH_1E4]
MILSSTKKLEWRRLALGKSPGSFWLQGHQLTVTEALYAEGRCTRCRSSRLIKAGLRTQEQVLRSASSPQIRSNTTVHEHIHTHPPRTNSASSTARLPEAARISSGNDINPFRPRSLDIQSLPPGMNRLLAPRWTAARLVIIPPPSPILSISRAFTNSSGGRNNDLDEEGLKAARQWLQKLDADTIPRDLCEVSFSRSSGPGGQNVNKVSSKATLRIPLSSLLPRLPSLLHDPLLRSRYHAPSSSSLVIQADDSRKQADNANACFQKLHELIVQAGRETVPGETSPEQVKRVEMLQKKEAQGRRRLKEKLSGKKSARRGGGGREE